jgi:hypothetical protein
MFDILPCFPQPTSSPSRGRDGRGHPRRYRFGKEQFHKNWQVKPWGIFRISKRLFVGRHANDRTSSWISPLGILAA